MPNRLICSVLNEMRGCYNTRNFSYLLGLIEEAQSLANRMESALETKHEIEYYEKALNAAKKAADKEEKRLERLQAKIDDLEYSPEE